MPNPLLQQTPRGIYCAKGDFYIDPQQPVERAIITHAHSDHARPGMGSYLTSDEGTAVLKVRLPRHARISGLAFGETRAMNGVNVSLHPAGHVLGSAQVRVEDRGEIWVVSGDYKTDHDVSCTPFELVRCHTFITEATFGLPVFAWPSPTRLFSDIDAWWQTNQEQGKVSIALAYSLGKAQRLLAGLPNPQRGPIFVHRSVAELNDAYESQGIRLPPTRLLEDNFMEQETPDRTQALVIAPPQVLKSSWLKQFGRLSVTFCSGWMLLESERKKRRVQHGFALSDHVDWASLHATVFATGAERVGVMHGFVTEIVRSLKSKGLEAFSFCQGRARHQSSQLDFSRLW